MNIGDKVRFTHGKEQGIIRNKIDERTFEVEIEDGFLIPVLKNEIVRIASEESEKFTPRATTTALAPTSPTDGVFVAFDPFNDRIYALMLLNDTNNTILFTIGEQSSLGFNGILSGTLGARTYTKISEYKLADFEFWPEIIAQLLIYKQGDASHNPPLEKKLKFNAVAFHKSKRNTKLLNKSTFLFQLDRDALKIDTSKIIEHIENNTVAAVISYTKPAFEVDLHIEKLTKDADFMQPQEMLYMQMNEFAKCLENALATGMDQITFIHGSGNGTLRNEIHKKLAKNKNIKFFKDAQKEKFGYGATLVQLS